MKKIFLLFLFLTFLNPAKVFAQTTPPFSVETDLTSLGIKKLKIETTYEKNNAVGLGQPNYEYSGHIIKMPTSPYYRMFYGARCFYDANRNCQAPVNGQYPNPNPIGGDGDHIKYAESDDGISWRAEETKPIIRAGRFDIPGVLPSNYDWNNQMDPTVIEWSKTYYMYYQKQVESEVEGLGIDRSMLCPKTQDGKLRQCDKILFATSNDLRTWTKDNSFQPIIKNAPPEAHFYWPKAIVNKDEIWLYFQYYASWIYNVGDEKPQESGVFLIKSKDPTAFDFNAKIKLNNPQSPYALPVGGQKAILWPDDPKKTLFVGIDTNWANGAWPTNSNPRIPTLLFSRDGINWTYNDTPRIDHYPPPTGDVTVGVPVAFTPALLNLNNVFCNLATDINGGLPPIATNNNRIETFYYCSTFDGYSREGIGSVFNSNISAGKITFENVSLPGDLNQDSRVNIFDYNLMVQNFGNTTCGNVADIDGNCKVDVFDYNILVGNFGK